MNDLVPFERLSLYRLTIILVLFGMAGCSPYVYKDEIATFSIGVNELADGYAAGLRSVEADRVSLQHEKWISARTKLALAPGCVPPVAGAGDKAQICELKELGAAAAPSPSPIVVQARRGLPIIKALSGYASALEAVTNAADRQALDGAQAQLRQSVSGLTSKIDPTLAGSAGAVTGLFGSITAAYLDTRRYQVLRSGVLEAQGPVTTLGGVLAEALDALRTARANELRPFADRSIDPLGPALDARTYAERLKTAAAATAAIDALNRADPAKAATDMIKAHEKLAVALKDDTRQLEPVVAAIKAFVEQAKAVNSAFAPIPTS